MQWKTILALIVIYVAMVMGWSWPWGVLFILWTLPAFYSGRVHLVEEVDRAENPVLFWLVVVTWLVLSLYMIATDLWNLF
ncbi:MAG: hypothetical protein AAF657_04710 [Acidobacteriota bacterium]